MFPSEPLLVATKLATLGLGLAVAVVARRAYRRTGSRALRALSIGFGLLAVGGVVAGLLHTVVGLPLVESQTVQSLFTAAGLAVIVHSLVLDDGVDDGRTDQVSQPTDGGD